MDSALKSTRDHHGDNTEHSQNLDEIFKCFICYGKVNNAVMCPHCSKLCCGSCIKVFIHSLNQIIEMVNRIETIVSPLSISVKSELVSELQICRRSYCSN